MSVEPLVCDTESLLLRKTEKFFGSSLCSRNEQCEARPLIFVETKNEDFKKFINNFQNEFKRLIKTKSIKFEKVSSQKKSAFIVLNEITILVPLEGIVDTEKEKSKLNDKKNIYTKKLKVVLDKLNNKAFIDKAPDNVIENFKIQEKEINSSIEKIDEIMNTIN